MRLDDAIAGIRSNREETRYPAFQFLLPISESRPETIYPHWQVFVDVLRMKEVANQYVAIPLIANLVRADVDRRFDALFDEFYGLLRHESPVVSPHVARVSGVILRARPDLQGRIVSLLLATDKTTRCRHKELLKSYVIDGLSEAYDVLTDKARVMAFVKRQVKSDSPKTRKKAKEFLGRLAK